MWANTVPVTVVIIAAVMVIQVGLKTQSFFVAQQAAVQRLEDAQKPIPDDKLEDTLKNWADGMGWGTRRLDNKDSRFAFQVTLPPQNGIVSVGVSRPSGDMSGYVVAAIRMNLTDTQKTAFDKLSPREAQNFLGDLGTELVRVKSNFSGIEKPFRIFQLQYQLPITSALTKHTFVSLVMDIAYASVLASETIIARLGV